MGPSGPVLRIGRRSVRPRRARTWARSGPPGRAPDGDRRVATAPGRAPDTAPDAQPVIDIPTRYGGPDAPDLDDVARRVGRSPAEVVALHVGRVYVVYMLGFSPGFAYLGTLPRTLELPRRDVPRTSVPAGSVAIAGRQTAVYPTTSPGGWNLLGRTDAVLWDPRRDPPSTLAPGRRVRFVPIAG